MKEQIVLARYNEDISWLQDAGQLPEITVVYDKGGIGSFFSKKLPNVGRESHTYLYHIVTHYDDLADVTLFSQADPIEHMPVLADRTKQGIRLYWIRDMLDRAAIGCVAGTHLFTGREWDKDGRLRHWGKWEIRYNNGELRKADWTMTEWFQRKLCFAGMPDNLSYFPGAVFAVTRKLIHSNSKKFYEAMLESIPLHPDPEEAYYFERAWLYLFGFPRIKVSSTFMGGLPITLDLQ